MHEMQTLTIQPESKEIKTIIPKQEIQVDPVDFKTKFRILDWMSQEVKLIKLNNNNEKLLEDLP